MSDRIEISVDRDGWTSQLQLQIAQLDETDAGTGYRLAGPKYNGSGATLLRHTLDERDAREIRAHLDRVFPLTVYRAAYEHDITPLETYALRAAARCHCEDEALEGLARDEAELQWETDPDEPEVEELHVDGQATGYTVTAVAIPSEYDPEAGR